MGDEDRLDFRRLPGPVLILPEESSFGGISAGSFSRTAAGNRAWDEERTEQTIFDILKFILGSEAWGIKQKK